jgi:ATP adenylyltransferase
MYHYRKTRKVYKSFPKPEKCDFCDESRVHRILSETAHVYVTKNRVFYDAWEMREVIDHLMIIPKRHVLSLNDLTDEERIDVMKVAGEYEAKGYNIYARAPDSTARSVPHQHTHLIKTAGKPKHGLLFIEKPYTMVTF